MRRIILIKLLFLCGLLSVIHCGNNSLAGGTSTSENGFILGKVVAADGTPSSRVQITLLPDTYDPVNDTAVLLKDTTDISGSYSFNRVPQGNYTIQSVHIDNRTRLFVNSFTIADDTVTRTSDTLRKPGSIKVILLENISDTTGYVYIPGSTVFAHIGSNSKYVILDSVPACTIPEVVYSADSTVNPSVLNRYIKVSSGDTATINNSKWKYSCYIFLNTSKSGADIDKDVYRFPVLVRLNSGNFDFSRATADGSDILFTNKYNTVLPCEIERWDLLNRKAEIWVKVDTIKGADSTNTINMYWGNSQSAAVSKVKSVFDNTEGFLAVWHFGESTDTIHDATANSYNGKRNGNIRRSECLIGYGQTFIDSTGSYFDMGNILNPKNSSFTISAWVRRADTGLQTIIAKTNGGQPSQEYGWNLSFGYADQLQFYTATGGSSWDTEGAFDLWSPTKAGVTDSTNWHHVTVVIDRSGNTGCGLYIDGIKTVEKIRGDITGIGSIVNTLSMRIGAEADGNFQLTGSIDECCVSGVVRSEAWNKLCYINQRADDLLVKFK